MSFSKSKSKRFADPVSQAPPVGIYDVSNGQEQNSGPVTFDHGSRFVEKRDQTPGPADTQPALHSGLNLSTASLNNTCGFATPSKPVKRCAKQKSSSINDLTCNESMSQQMSHLQYKINELEKSLQRTAKDKAVTEKNLQIMCKEKDEILNQLQELHANGGETSEQMQVELEASEKELSRLTQDNIKLDSLKKSLEADIELGRQNEDALREQIDNLNVQKSEMMNQIGELELTISQFQAILDQVRNDKRMCDEYALNLTVQLKGTQLKLADVQTLYDEELAEVSKLNEYLDDQKRQSETLQTRLDEIQKRFEKVSIETQSFQEKCFNLETAKEVLTEENIKLTEDLSRAKSENTDLKEELENLENMTTESLRSLTVKYQDLEESNAVTKEECEKKENILRAELEVTKLSWHSLQSDLDVMSNTYGALRQDYDTVSTEANEFATKLENAENALIQLQSKNEQLNCKAEQDSGRHEMERQMLLREVEKLKTENEAKDSDALNHKKEISALKSAVSDLEEEKQLLFQRLNQADKDMAIRNEEIKETKHEMQNALAIKEESIKNITEELGRRIIETQTKLAASEHAFRCKLQAEQKSYSKLIEEHERLLKGETVEALKEESEMWRRKFEELEAKARPFQTQLELFEQEKLALLSENDWKESEMAKLAERYAQILGHQNNKQKIHHIVKIKEENLSLKKEVSKLRAQVSREKFSKNSKANSPKVQKKSRFDPAKAFQRAGKENESNKPLAELRDSDLNSTAAMW